MIGCALTIIIIILVLVLCGLLLFRLSINRFLANTREKIIDNCLNLAEINYTETLTKPKVPGQYEYTIARALLETSLKVTQSNCYNIIPIDTPPGFTEQARIQGINPWSNNVEMFCIVFSSGSKYLIVFTGTMFPDEIMNDLNIRQTDTSSLNNHIEGSMVHQGFYNVYMAIRPELWSRIVNPSELYITGHSLGGALSTLCAFYFAQYKPTHYSFGSPRVGNVTFAEKYNELVDGVRVYNIADTITVVPPPLILNLVYQHVKGGVAFDINTGNMRDNHIKAYLTNMPKCVPYRGC